MHTFVGPNLEIVVVNHMGIMQRGASTQHSGEGRVCGRAYPGVCCQFRHARMLAVEWICAFIV